MVKGGVSECKPVKVKLSAGDLSTAQIVFDTGLDWSCGRVCGWFTNAQCCVLTVSCLQVGTSSKGAVS